MGVIISSPDVYVAAAPGEISLAATRRSSSATSSEMLYASASIVIKCASTIAYRRRLGNFGGMNVKIIAGQHEVGGESLVTA